MDFSKPIDKYDHLQELFNNNLKKEVLHLEKLRKKAIHERTWARIKLPFYLILSNNRGNRSSFSLTNLFNGSQKENLFSIGFSSLLSDEAKEDAYHKYNELVKEYISDYKNIIIRPILNLIEPSLDYNPYSGIPSYTYRKSGLHMQEFDRYFSSDQITGKDEGAAFKLCLAAAFYNSENSEITIKNVNDIDSSGFFIEADPRKHFQGKTYIFPKKLSIKDRFNTFISQGVSGKGSPVILEDPDFNKEFQVYSSNQQEARYLITTSFIQKIISINNSIGNRRLALSFVDRKLYIFILCPKENLLCPDIDKKATSFDNARDIFMSLVQILRIIDSLELGNRIWSKR